MKFEIVDSVYNSQQPKGVVLEQDPQPGFMVKENRTIYLTMNAFYPPSLPMPRLIDNSIRLAKIILENNGLKLKDYTFIPDVCKNCVLKQLYKGEEIEEGALVPKGAKIDLVVGMGISNDRIRVPLLVELTIDSAMKELQRHYLNLGGENYDETVFTLEDSMTARVYMQDPPYSATSSLPLGSSVNLWFTMDTSKIDTKLRDGYVTDSTSTQKQPHDSSTTTY